jgi:hypothetical protein
MNANELMSECRTLINYWNPRKAAFKEWHSLLILENNLHQEGMESFISNEPRTFYNMSLRVLTPNPMIHKISTLGLEEKVDVAQASTLEAFIRQAWINIEHQYRRAGRQSWYHEFLGFLLEFGWYSVFVMATDTELIAEVWNPAEVYPNFSLDGLTSCAHVYPIAGDEANRLAKSKGWSLPQPIRGNTVLYDYWVIGDGIVYNGIVLGGHLVKDLTPDLSFNGAIPILCSPVGGLPDRGAVTGSSDWKKTIGQGILAANKDLYDNYNRQQTFIQQLIRDTAQPKWYEKTRGRAIISPDQQFVRGGIFRMTPEEDVGTIPVPPIPVEATATLMRTEAQLQKGQLHGALFGGGGELPNYLIAQVAAQANQILAPYYEATKGITTDIDNMWLESIQKHKLHPYGFRPPEALPENLYMEADYKLYIPGDTIQRATTLKMLSPEAKLSTTTALDLFMPEVGNPVLEQAKANKDDALQHPIMKLIDLVAALEEQAGFLRKAGDKKGAERFEKAAKMIEKQLSPQTPQEQPTVSRIRPEAAPRQALPPRELRGRQE